jgi:hypothetical protein
MKRTPFNWDLCLQNRKRRLAKLLQLNAPNVILQWEAEMLLEAFCKGKWRAVWWLFRRTLSGRIQHYRFSVWYWWMASVRGMTNDQIGEVLENSFK